MKKIFGYVAIPAEDFNRAFAFYSEITGGYVERNPNVPFPMAYFVEGDGNRVGHLFDLPSFKPSADGAVVYMELEPDLSTTVAQIEHAEGKMIMPKPPLGPGNGFWALFLGTDCSWIRKATSLHYIRKPEGGKGW